MPSSIWTLLAAWNWASPSSVTNAASGTPWNSSSGGGRWLTPGVRGQTASSNETACSQMLLMPGNRAGIVTWAFSQ